MAIENGIISLSVRNPLDRKEFDYKKWRPVQPAPDDRTNIDWKEQSVPDHHPNMARLFRVDFINIPQSCFMVVEWTIFTISRLAMTWQAN